MEEAQDDHLIVKVQMRLRLVENHEFWLARECAGDVDHLQLSAAEFRCSAIRERQDADEVEQLRNACAIRRRRCAEQSDAPRASHHDHLEHSVREGGRVTLRHIADHLTDRLGHRDFPIYVALPARPRQDAEQTAEEGGLTDAVTPEDGEDLARRNGEAEIGEEFVHTVVGKGGIFHRNHDQSPCFSRVRVSKNAKKGAPRSAVRMPMGSSAARRLRAQMSTSARKIAPTRHAAGSSRA